MKYYIATAFAALLIGTATTPSVAEDQPSANSSSHTMAKQRHASTDRHR